MCLNSACWIEILLITEKKNTFVKSVQRHTQINKNKLNLTGIFITVLWH